MPRKSKFSTEEVLAILREVAGGATVRAVCKRNGFTEKTFYRWRTRFGQGLTALPGERASRAAAPSDAPRFGQRDEEMRRLVEENRQLKELVADLSLENRELRNAPAARPPAVRLIAAPRDRDRR
jgi:putative transposase